MSRTHHELWRPLRMQMESTAVEGVLLIKPDIFSDERGCFLESWNRKAFADLGLDIDFVQDNFSRSAPGVLRGLHYQTQQPQGKLVRVTRGRVLDVAVDLRRHSPSFGQHVAVELNGDSLEMLWIPPGCAHGFYVLGDTDADLHYKCSAPYSPADERIIHWRDPDLAIPWPLAANRVPRLSPKDARGEAFRDAPLFD